MPPFRAGSQTLHLMLCNELANPCKTPSARVTHRTQASGWWCTGPRFSPTPPRGGGPFEVQGLWPFLSLPLSQSVAWARYLWWRTISVPSWGWLCLATSGVGHPLWKETLPHNPAGTTIFPAGGCTKWGISRKGWEAKIWMPDGRSCGHLPGRNWLKPGVTQYFLYARCCARCWRCNSEQSRRNSLPSWTYPLTWGGGEVSQVTQSHQTQIRYL